IALRHQVAVAGDQVCLGVESLALLGVAHENGLESVALRPFVVGYGKYLLEDGVERGRVRGGIAIAALDLPRFDFLDDVRRDLIRRKDALHDVRSTPGGAQSLVRRGDPLLPAGRAIRRAARSRAASANSAPPLPAGWR